MKLKPLFLLSFLSLITISFCLAQKEILYKKIDSTDLFLEVYYPPQVEAGKSQPAMVFFFGGGWVGGDKAQFLNQAKYLSKRGIVCFLVDYRIKNAQDTSPFESLKDAKSAIRFIRKNAGDFHIDPTKIIASGGSAGGHLAAATVLIEGYNEDSDDLAISAIPNALVLFNPVIDNGPGGYGYERIQDANQSFSPLHNIKAGAPPTLILLGTNDALIPVITAQYYQQVMKKVGSRCELRLYEGAEHGFFNYRNFEYYKNTLMETDHFLTSLGYLKAEPIVEIN